jgi:phosphatidyl-myo-inositol dimannoside synthase
MHRVLLLSPSHGLGGGIERWVETLESAFAAEGVESQRLDLSGPGVRAHARLLARGRAILRADQGPTRLVVAHRALLPVAAVLAKCSAACEVSVLCHGSEMWDSRWRPRRKLERHLMRGAGVRVVAGSNFIAGSLIRDCRATVLPPALSREWFDTLTAAAASRPGSGPGIRVTTAFRLADWRMKGLPRLLEAVTALGRRDVRLTICGSGNPPADVLRMVSGHSWCVLRLGLDKDGLAHELAAADLFVLATYTKRGHGGVGEGFGLVLLEAQAAGTPVIAPAYGGSREAYIEGVTGIAPTDESAEALTKTLQDLLKDPVRLEWMSRQAAQWARQTFAPERYAQLAVRRLLLPHRSHPTPQVDPCGSLHQAVSSRRGARGQPGRAAGVDGEGLLLGRLGVVDRGPRRPVDDPTRCSRRPRRWTPAPPVRPRRAGTPAAAPAPRPRCR